MTEAMTWDKLQKRGVVKHVFEISTLPYTFISMKNKETNSNMVHLGCIYSGGQSVFLIPMCIRFCVTIVIDWWAVNIGKLLSIFEK